MLTLQTPNTELITSQVSLASMTSYRVGGNAQWYAAPKNRDELYTVFDWFSQRQLPLTLLGWGSNLLISDKGIEGLVISTRYLRHRQFDEENGQITAAAGESIQTIAWKAAKRGWSGLEWAVGIPGTVGGAVVMNAGAHEGCAADALVKAVVMSPNGTIETLTSNQLDYDYRTSNLQGGQKIVLEATFQLKTGFEREAVKAESTHNLHRRKNTQPYDKPSCGSVFRNPYPQAAGRLIEELGLKGYQIGDAQVSERHANFIVNCGQAKAADVFRLIRHVQEKVDDQWNLWLKPEVKMLGEFPVL
ncbi:MAG: UDP-N-acetylmuramate dehydrogenase [Microcystaceae cyanobacterium]